MLSVKYLESFDRQTRPLVKSLYSREEVILTIKDIMLEVSDEGFQISYDQMLSDDKDDYSIMIQTDNSIGRKIHSFFYKQIKSQVEDSITRIKKILPHHDIFIKYRTTNGWTNGILFQHNVPAKLRLNDDTMLYQILIQIKDL
jgi:hypothetical protein